MYAHPLPQPSPEPTRHRRRVPRSSRRQHQNPYHAIAVETGIKLAVNVVLSLVAISALVKLLPYQSTQESKLKELDVAVNSTQKRVDQVQTVFRESFDPSQSRSLMQQATNRISPSQRQIILTPLAANEAEKAPLSAKPSRF